MSENALQKFINPDHAIMNWQPVVKLDNLGKQKIDRIIVLTSHQILILYDGVLELEIKSMLDVKYLHYVIKSSKKGNNEMMLCFNNKGKSNMHIILEEEPGEFFDLLKLRWALFNPDKTLKVFAVPESSLLGYVPDKKYNIQNMPAEKYRIRDEEVISNDEYLEMQSTGKVRTESIDQSSIDFEFDNSRGIANTPSSKEASSPDQI